MCVCVCVDTINCFSTFTNKGFEISMDFIVDQLIKLWAPLVWLAPQEKFMPLGVEEFLSHVHPEKRGKPFTSDIPIGDTSEKAYLVTNIDIGE